MYKITIGVEGMLCPKCEAHMKEALATTVMAERITASHEKKECVLIAKEALDKALLKETVANTGYKFTSYKIEPYKRFIFF